MTENELRDYCSNTTAPPSNHPFAWPHFVTHMKGRMYGYEETVGAWLWFLHGWNARRDTQR